MEALSKDEYKYTDNQNDVISIVDLSRYRHAARANEYPYHVNALHSLAYNNNIILLFSHDILRMDVYRLH